MLFKGCLKAAKLACALGFVLLLGAERLQAAAFRFILSFDPSVSKSPFSGRVYIFLMPREFSGPPRGVSWFNPEPIFARDIKDWKPGESLLLDDKALAYPLPLAKLKKTTYWVAAVMDFDTGDRSFSAAPGNGYSKPVRATIDPSAGGAIDLQINQVVPPRRVPGQRGARALFFSGGPCHMDGIEGQGQKNQDSRRV